MKKLLILPLLIFLCVPFWAFAQNYSYDDDDDTIENTIGFGPRIGYYHVDDFDDGTFFYGLQARARLGPAVGLEGSISYRPGTENSFIVDDVEQSFETKFVPITASLLLFLPISPAISPYGLAGAGAYYTIYDTEGDLIDDIDSEFNFGYHLGFGVELPFGENVALSLDYRYIFLTADNGDTPDDADFSGNAFTGAIMFYF